MEKSNQALTWRRGEAEAMGAAAMTVGRVRGPEAQPARAPVTFQCQQHSSKPAH